MTNNQRTSWLAVEKIPAPHVVRQRSVPGPRSSGCWSVLYKRVVVDPRKPFKMKLTCLVCWVQGIGPGSSLPVLPGHRTNELDLLVFQSAALVSQRLVGLIILLLVDTT